MVDYQWAGYTTQERSMSLVLAGPVSVERMAVADNPWAGYATQERRMSVGENDGCNQGATTKLPTNYSTWTQTPILIFV